jgi:hypothetical protein
VVEELAGLIQLTILRLALWLIVIEDVSALLTIVVIKLLLVFEYDSFIHLVPLHLFLVIRASIALVMANVYACVQNIAEIMPIGRPSLSNNYFFLSKLIDEVCELSNFILDHHFGVVKFILSSTQFLVIQLPQICLDILIIKPSLIEVEAFIIALIQFIRVFQILIKHISIGLLEGILLKLLIME